VDFTDASLRRKREAGVPGAEEAEAAVAAAAARGVVVAVAIAAVEIVAAPISSTPRRALAWPALDARFPSAAGLLMTVAAGSEWGSLELAKKGLFGGRGDAALSGGDDDDEAFVRVLASRSLLPGASLRHLLKKSFADLMVERSRRERQGCRIAERSREEKASGGKRGRR